VTGNAEGDVGKDGVERDEGDEAPVVLERAAGIEWLGARNSDMTRGGLGREFREGLKEL